MDSQALHRLMLDDALGVLTDDVRALVAEQIAAAGPGAAAEAAAYRETVALARRALAAQHSRPATLPPFPVEQARAERFERGHRNGATDHATPGSGGVWLWAGRAAALAACLVLGVGLGFAIFGRTEQPAPSAPAAGTMAVASAGGSARGVRDFWSVRRMAGMPDAEEPPPAKPSWFAPAAKSR